MSARRYTVLGRRPRGTDPTPGSGPSAALSELPRVGDVLRLVDECDPVQAERVEEVVEVGSSGLVYVVTDAYVYWLGRERTS